jgi:hypothetical protein
MRSVNCYTTYVAAHNTNKIRSSRKISGIDVQYWQLCSFRKILVKAPVLNLPKYRLVGAALIYADGRMEIEI